MARKHVLYKLTFALIAVQCIVIVKYVKVNILKYKQGLWVFVKTKTVEKRMDRLTQDVTTGKLNLHEWYDICAKDFDILCNSPMFPMAPDNTCYSEKSTNRWNLTASTGSSRLFGFLTARETGEYIFEVVSTNLVELWLSTNEDTNDAQRLAATNSQDKTTQISRSNRIFLEDGKKYFIEILALGLRKGSYLNVQWQTPTNSAFETIQKDFLSSYVQDSSLNNLKVYRSLPDSPTCFSRRIKNEYFDVKHLKYISHEEFENVLLSCNYQPSYTVHNKIRTYEAVTYHVVHTFIYPFPEHEQLQDKKHWIYPLEKAEAHEIVDLYMESLHSTHPGKFALREVKSVERKKDEEKGSRYLIELELQDLTRDETLILSEYVFLPVDQKQLCYPVNFQWNKTADVYLLVTAKNQGSWLHHFIKNVERILTETNDKHLHVVIFDYNSPDINLEKVLNESSLTSYQVLKRSSDYYSRTESFTEAMKLVPDPHSIVFMLDLHLDIASSFIDSIRKHCIEGRIIYTPIIVNLACGASPSNLAGEWQVYGYGLVGMYKSDWEESGGFPHVRRRWGGEDWELIDQLFGIGLEFERMRTPYVYHYHHSKKRMWRDSSVVTKHQC